MSTAHTAGIIQVAANGYSTRLECVVCHVSFTGAGHLSAAEDHAFAAHADRSTRLADLLDLARYVMFTEGPKA